MCVNFIYDLNGSKGPNTAGKDIGIMTVFNATDSTVVAPMPSSASNAGNTTYTWYNAAKACTTQDSESRIPNIDELSAMMFNKDVINLASVTFWSGSVYSSDRALGVNAVFGPRGSSAKGHPRYVRCVRR